jgi:hypothetical protein
MGGKNPEPWVFGSADGRLTDVIAKKYGIVFDGTNGGLVRSMVDCKRPGWPLIGVKHPSEFPGVSQ